MTIVFGIDPGLTGAIAVLRMPGTVLLDVQAMPTITEQLAKRKRNRVSGDALRTMLVHWGAYPGEKLVFIERVSAMPKQGVVSMFSFGRALGVVEGVVAALGLPREWVSPQVWQRGVKLAKPDNALTMATERFPNFAAQFSRKADDGKADAALIALYGSTQIQPNGGAHASGTLGDDLGTIL